MEFSKFNIIHETNGEVFIYNTISEVLISINNNSFDLLKKNADVYLNSISEEEQNIIITSKIIANDKIEVADIIKKREAEHSNNKLYTVIYPTLNCNFKCNYCFQSEYPCESMNNNTVESIMHYFEHQFMLNKNSQLFITWMGGEPLLSLDIIESISSKLNKKYKTSYFSKIITNGFLLTNTTLSILESSNVYAIQITIDGLSDVHDKRRITKEGGGTFNVILKNIDFLLKNHNKIHLIIRVNLDKQNIDKFSEIYNFFHAKYNGYNYSIYPCFVDNFSIVCKSGIDTPSSLPRETRSRFFLDLICKDNIKIIDYLPRYSQTSCLSKIKNSIAVGPDGGVYKCTTLVGDKRFCIGNIEDNNIYKKINTKPFSLESKCLECNLFPVCDGGCPILNINSNSSQNCHISKGFEKEFVSAYLLNLNS